MDGFTLLAGASALVTAMGAVESYVHRRRLERIPIRIHVNGTRGKSSVTRLIAAGLRAGGVRTCAKTTGTVPQMIFPDGSEFPVFRPSRANVIEQLRVVRAAVAHRAEALVVECMALHPQLQSLCELKIVQSTHGVITNARPDHLDVMGPSTENVAQALAGTVPVGGRLFTAEQQQLPVFQQAALDRGTQLVPFDEDIVSQVSWDDMSQFSHIEHRENVALALQVCAAVGVDRQRALEGMWQAAPDPGVMSLYRVVESNRNITFVNGFAANDPDSTGQNWNLVNDWFPHVDRRIAIFNCRSDRPDRSVQLAEACLRWKPADHYLLIGTATDVFAKRARAAGMSGERLISAERQPTNRLIQTLQSRAGHSALVMGMGNISGPGMDLIDYFRARGDDSLAVTGPGSERKVA